MRVQIVDIGEGDSFHSQKERFIGQKCTFVTERVRDGFCGGQLYFDDESVFGYSNPHSFYAVKTKPICD